MAPEQTLLTRLRAYTVLSHPQMGSAQVVKDVVEAATEIVRLNDVVLKLRDEMAGMLFRCMLAELNSARAIGPRVSALDDLCWVMLTRDIVAAEGHTIPVGTKGMIRASHPGKTCFDVSFAEPEPTIVAVDQSCLTSVKGL